MIRKPAEKKLVPLKANALTTAPPTVNSNDAIFILNDKQLTHHQQSKV